MKNTKSIVSKRREKILDYLKSNESINTNDLAEILEISPLTLRRDLQALDEQGLIVRYYGGAKLANDINNSENILKETDTDLLLNKKKNIIAKYAADLIKDGDTVFINSSSTALLMLKYLGNKRVYIVTNNGKALQVTIPPNVELVLTGGQVYERKQSLVGDFATYILSKITADKCFLGVSGITSDSGISTSVLQETLINHEMINRCNGPVYILADSSKVGRHHNFSSGDIEEISHLITDSDVDKNELNLLKEKNVDTIILDYK
ncbi:DeoR/GlpR transcriptional regulator [Clostridium botulinum]|uniref:DeoR/GlpR transcriptional regulator n=1 Tax=Clostridium botulinum TaxID=1491 RepID=A0A0C2NTS9_CLOBO|nr:MULTISPECIES: DeoR/GlpR family DNA-binding transcription regulator [Clostridium]ACD52935.1 transcriptional regulator, DeoR family [Clostridium botulinum E3 str. Alaska E43]AJF30827.1 DeoR faimly transcriptional regulator [Clostridium botulinum]AJF33890.1 DeoR faimly transcriptional regulator [Clostridium botulinum]EES48693.1 transcriptional regulator, DeoR family [Clostridium botulinum E1 str. 'BoNT E Beluga']KAI3348934.1 DeoR/GlpR family DNA-binding transcription regulator [Clostridium bot